MRSGRPPVPERLTRHDNRVSVHDGIGGEEASVRTGDREAGPFRGVEHEAFSRVPETDSDPFAFQAHPVIERAGRGDRLAVGGVACGEGETAAHLLFVEIVSGLVTAHEAGDTSSRGSAAVTRATENSRIRGCVSPFFN